MKILIAAAAATLFLTPPAFAEGDNGEHHVAFENVEWFDGPAPGVQLAHLWGDDETGARYFFKLEPGVAVPMHVHTHDYWGMTIQGNWVHIEADGTEVPTAAADYAFVEGGVGHADRCDGDIPCLGLIDFSGPLDLALAE